MGVDTQITGNIGMFYAAYRLSRYGWNVMPTARNARGVDLLAYNGTATRFIGIQVKALSKRSPVPLGGSLDKVMGDWWIIIAHAIRDEPLTAIMTPDEVRLAAHRGESSTGKVSYWLQPNRYDTPEYRNEWGRIGFAE